MNDHRCVIEYVAEGEAVCFECGALYIYASTLHAESLKAYHEAMDETVSSSAAVTGEDQ